MSGKALRPATAAAVLATAGLALAAYAYEYRYFLRIVPLPAAAAGELFAPNGPAPELAPRGRIEFPAYDLTDPAGLRSALDHIRAMSPLKSGAGPVGYAGVDFSGWLRQLADRAMYCTDASLLFALMAHQQGLRVREWWLWYSRSYANGDAHSLVGFYNPRIERWQIVDPFTATILLRPDGSPASMEHVIAGESLVYDRSPRIEAANVPEYDIAHIIESHRRDRLTPVLNLKPPTWFAATPKRHLVIGYAIVTPTSAHSAHIYLTKLAALLGLGALVGAIGICRSALGRSRNAGARAAPAAWHDPIHARARMSHG